MPTLEDLLATSRTELLDLSTRNRLLSIPVSSKSARIVRVEDELGDPVYRLLVAQGKTLGFLPGRAAAKKRPGRPERGLASSPVPELVGGGDVVDPEAADDEAELPPPDEETEAGTGLARRHVDLRLQTTLTPEGLQRRLLDLYRDARTMIEEQGVNVLYLAVGQLKWFEADATDTPYHAPLVLIPVVLSRRSASDRFVLAWTGEDLEENLSLRAKLKSDFGIELPPFPEDDGFEVGAYCRAVARAVGRVRGWELLPDAIVLGFFSFAKFLMYRDLVPGNWPDPAALTSHPLVRGLLVDGFPDSEPWHQDGVNLDELIPVARLDHVVDADGSQSLAIEAVRQGRSLVIQGPPGTGKSQSITNLIATAVLDGQRVLFVAEKLAALEVVKRRLEREGLGDLCLELHGSKSSKRVVIEEIGRTWKLGRPKSGDLESLVPRLEARRNTLNDHVTALHERHEASGLTPFVVIGHLTALGRRGAEAEGAVFPGATAWSAGQRAEYRRLVEELAERIEQMGLPGQHPWRGVGREAVLRIDLGPLSRSLHALAAALEALREVSVPLAGALGQPVPATLAEAERQRRIAEGVAAAPPVDRAALGHAVWDAGLDGLRDLVVAGRRHAEAVARIGGQVTETAWDRDSGAARSVVAAHGRSLFRFLNGDYRRAVAEVRGCLVADWPRAHAERLVFLDTLVAGQQARRRLREADMLGAAALGAVWRREKTDWNQVEAILAWVEGQREAGLGSGFRSLFAGLADPTAVADRATELGRRLAVARERWEELVRELALDCPVAFGVPDPGQVPLAMLNERIAAWLAAPEELSRWNLWFLRARSARQACMEALVERLETGAIPAAAAVDGFDRIYFGQLLREMVARRPQLAQFDGDLHSRHVAEFRELDRERLALAKVRVLNAHFERLPSFHAGVGGAGIVKAEMERKRGHRTVRRLLRDAGSVVQAIKPVFMMSPLSVAQFLEPGAVEFDLLVIDEASQVQPVDALGAVARAKRVVVVGDSKQLPPTRFFARLTSGEETGDDGDPGDGEAGGAQPARAEELESILGLCRARGLPERMLRWHYRSRHQSLIAVSNHEFYDDRLFIVPSPVGSSAGLGVFFRHVPDGVFDSGASGTNRIEARTVGRAVIEHARTTPHLSLGVAAFSVRQQQAILDELELLRRENRDLEAFFAPQGSEPFFVKNLENVQGDERDVIFISVGYGRDVHGYLAMRFGPLSNEGGERRLNVLISRAKRRCEVFSSITADDIDLQRASGRGVAAFKTFLEFARTGRLGTARLSGREEESPFEEAVRRSVESLGHPVHPQVGVAGFFIDLAVVDPTREGRYLLGIECDGASYHASRSARDRDRLRQAVLEDHGWIIHRVWSTDWFQRPEQQLRRIAEALDRARGTLAERDRRETPLPESRLPGVPAPESEPGEAVEREAVAGPESPGLAALAVSYREARFEVPTQVEPQNLPARELAGVVARIVEIEGPIHEDEVVNRVRDLWGYGRAGSRIQDAVAKAVRSVLVARRCEREDGFLSLPGAPVPIRCRASLETANLRKPDLLPPAELRAAILAVIDLGHGARREEIAGAVARMLGFKATGSQLRTVIEAQRDRLLRRGELVESNGLLRRSAGENRPPAAV